MRLSDRQFNVAVLSIMLCLLQASLVKAGNLSFIGDGPVGQFTDEDVRLMNANIDATVADAKIHIVHSWSNPAKKHSGTAEALQAFTGPNDVPCKRVRITNRAGNLKGQGRYTLCKMDGREWTFVSNDYAPPPKSGNN